MSHSLKSFTLLSIFFALGFISADHNRLEAAYGRWGAYDNERGAWGGNGGWWGDSHHDWYGDYGTPEERNHYYSNPYYSNYGHYWNDYSYHNNYPYDGQYFDDSVDGAALYFHIQ